MTLSIGVDLAQARDRTVLAAVHSYVADAVTADAEVDRPRRRAARRVKHHALIALEKLRPGMAYPAQVEAIVAFADSLTGEEKPVLVADATGVGRAVLDLLRAASPFVVRGVTLTGASEAVAHGKDWSVPKSDLVATLEVALSTRRLHAEPGLALAGELRDELAAFGYEMSSTGRPIYEGKGSHDDMVIALALGVWAGERGASTAAFKEFIDAEVAKRDDGGRQVIGAEQL